MRTRGHGDHFATKVTARDCKHSVSGSSGKGIAHLWARGTDRETDINKSAPDVLFPIVWLWGHDILGMFIDAQCGAQPHVQGLEEIADIDVDWFFVAMDLGECDGLLVEDV